MSTVPTEEQNRADAILMDEQARRDIAAFILGKLQGDLKEADAVLGTLKAGEIPRSLSVIGPDFVASHWIGRFLLNGDQMALLKKDPLHFEAFNGASGALMAANQAIANARAADGHPEKLKEAAEVVRNTLFPALREGIVKLGGTPTPDYPIDIRELAGRLVALEAKVEALTKEVETLKAK